MNTWLRIYICLIWATLLLTWCGSSVSWPVVTFESPLQIQIPEWYEEIAPWTVENKQIINKVLKAYKKISEDDEVGFQDNIIITKSEFAEPLDYDQFWTVNQRLMTNQLVWYQPGELERTSFECDWNRNSLLIVNFVVQSDILQYFAQAQFVRNEIGYILSFASSDEDERDDAMKWLAEINCGEIVE